MLGELEQLVLLAVLRIDGGAYAVTIRDEIETRAGIGVLRGSVYVTLDRLERKGWVSSRMGDPLPERGGKARRYFRLTAAGRRALRESRRAYGRMWEGLETV